MAVSGKVGSGKMSKSIALVVLVLALGLSPLAAQPAFEVADLGHRVTDNLPQSGLVSSSVLNGVTYIVLSDGLRGYELWRSDGTVAGTGLVKDLCPGSCPGAFGNPTVLGSLLYFEGSDGGHITLFQTDGTAAGTIPVSLRHQRSTRRDS